MNDVVIFYLTPRVPSVQLAARPRDFVAYARDTEIEMTPRDQDILLTSALRDVTLPVRDLTLLVRSAQR